MRDGWMERDYGIEVGYVNVEKKDMLNGWHGARSTV